MTSSQDVFHLMFYLPIGAVFHLARTYWTPYVIVCVLGHPKIKRSKDKDQNMFLKISRTFKLPEGIECPLCHFSSCHADVLIAVFLKFLEKCPKTTTCDPALHKGLLFMSLGSDSSPRFNVLDLYWATYWGRPFRPPSARFAAREEIRGLDFPGHLDKASMIQRLEEHLHRKQLSPVLPFW